MMFESWLGKGSWTKLAIQVERVAPLVDTPSIVRASLDQIGCLPKILATGAYPDATRLLIAGHAPRVPEPEGPSLRTCIFHSDKRVVLWHRVGFPRLRMVDI